MNDLSENRCDHNASEGFHDCYVLGIFSDRVEGKAEITILCEFCGARLAVVLDGIFRMSVHDFWEGNIISDLIQHEWPDMRLEWLADLLHTGDPEELREPHADIDRIRNENMILVHVTPSYGCEILALCKSVTVRGPEDDFPCNLSEQLASEAAVSNPAAGTPPNLDMMDPR